MQFTMPIIANEQPTWFEFVNSILIMVMSVVFSWNGLVLIGYWAHLIVLRITALFGRKMDAECPRSDASNSTDELRHNDHANDQ